MAKIKTFELAGGFFQAGLISSFLYRTYFFMSPAPFMITALDIFGMLIFGHCLYRLYFCSARTKTLLTNGLFKYTRHPMYTGAVLMDLRFWFGMWSPEFLVSALAFYISLTAAAYFQEKETLSRFGKDAETYYAKTPRLFIIYPLMRRRIYAGED